MITGEAFTAIVSREPSDIGQLDVSTGEAALLLLGQTDGLYTPRLHAILEDTTPTKGNTVIATYPKGLFDVVLPTGFLHSKSIDLLRHGEDPEAELSMRGIEGHQVTCPGSVRFILRDLLVVHFTGMKGQPDIDPMYGDKLAFCAVGEVSGRTDFPVSPAVQEVVFMSADRAMHAMTTVPKDPLDNAFLRIWDDQQRAFYST